MSKSKKKKSANTSFKQHVDEADVSLYEPVLDLAQDSPLRTQGNLTGIPRRLKDMAADWYNIRIKWKKISNAGLSICNKIGNIKTESLIGDDPLPNSLLPLCDELEMVVISLSRLVDKMKHWTESAISIRELLISQNKCTEVIFQTWPIERYVTSFEELSEMYAREYKVKVDVYQSICHTSSRDEMLFLLAAWNHDPFLDDNILIHIDAMATETGHSSS